MYIFCNNIVVKVFCFIFIHQLVCIHVAQPNSSFLFGEHKIVVKICIRVLRRTKAGCLSYRYLINVSHFFPVWFPQNIKSFKKFGLVTYLCLFFCLSISIFMIFCLYHCLRKIFAIYQVEKGLLQLVLYFCSKRSVKFKK